MSEKLKEFIKPLTESETSLKDHKLALHQLFTLAVTNIPDNETENFTAKKLSPTYLALCELLENI